MGFCDECIMPFFRKKKKEKTFAHKFYFAMMITHFFFHFVSDSIFNRQWNCMRKSKLFCVGTTITTTTTTTNYMQWFFLHLELRVKSAWKYILIANGIWLTFEQVSMPKHWNEEEEEEKKSRKKNIVYFTTSKSSNRYSGFLIQKFEIPSLRSSTSALVHTYF